MQLARFAQGKRGKQHIVRIAVDDISRCIRRAIKLRLDGKRQAAFGRQFHGGGPRMPMRLGRPVTDDANQVDLLTAQPSGAIEPHRLDEHVG